LTTPFQQILKKFQMFTHSATQKTLGYGDPIGKPQGTKKDPKITKKKQWHNGTKDNGRTKNKKGEITSQPRPSLRRFFS